MIFHMPFSRSSYHFSRELFQRPTRSRRFWTLYYLDGAFFAYVVFRVGFIYLVVTNPELLKYFRHRDPGVRFFSGLDSFLTAFTWVIELFHFTCKSLLVRIDLKAPVWRFWAGLTVQLQENYYRCKRGPTEVAEAKEKVSRNLKGRLRQEWPLMSSVITSNWPFNWVIAEVAAPLIVWLEMEDVDKEQFYGMTRPFGLPTLADCCKRKAALYMVIADRMICLVLNGIALVAPFLIWVVRESAFSGFSFPIQLWAAFEAFLIVYCIFRLLPVAFFFTNASALAALVQGGHCRHVKGELQRLIIKSRKRGNNRKYLYPHEALKVVQLLEEHNVVSRLIMEGNRALWGSVMAVFVLTNLPLNIFALSIIVLSVRKTVFEVVSLNIVLLLQLVAFIITMGPLSVTSERVHGVQNSLVALQPYLMGDRWVGLKLKLDCLKEWLSCGSPKVSITIGPAREVTLETLFELLGMYFAYLILVFSQQLEKRSSVQN